ncbi:glycosyltransferase [Umezawaea sp. Da 62-37]|uniref:glycosyltransferase n=1 Tax=Umezawaea sp. Da 62-37 TaxID=3075927 RepID=UPI0028F6FEF9|nr:glycosyltransferase [Umezawaea sp. Da 62-37]WNV87231.1 glycosyltransferase [Umezawaea sp. Da 62-37]
MNIPPDNRTRVLVTVNPFESHVRGLVTLVTTLGELGHDVRIAVPDGWSGRLRDYGVTTVEIGPMWVAPRFATAVFGALLDGGATGFDRTLIAEFTSPRFVGPVVDGVLRLSEHWRPHVVVHECTEFGGYLAAEVLGIPHVVVDIGSMAAIAQGLHEELIRPALTALRSRLGLAPEPLTPGILRHLTVTMTPERFNHADFEPPLARYRHEFPVRHDERLPDVFARLPEDRPVIYLSMGSIGPLSSRFMQRSTEIYEEIFTALAALECSVIAALPSRYEPLFRSLPPHVHTMPWVPQSLVLDHVDLFITHGGLNSIRDTITSGVPQVLLPFFADHPGNALRCEQLGTGIRVDPTTVTAAEVHSACERVLANPSYRRETEGLRRHMRALPPQTAFAGDLERLVEEHSAGVGVS